MMLQPRWDFPAVAWICREGPICGGESSHDHCVVPFDCFALKGRGLFLGVAGCPEHLSESDGRFRVLLGCVSCFIFRQRMGQPLATIIRDNSDNTTILANMMNSHPSFHYTRWTVRLKCAAHLQNLRHQLSVSTCLSLPTNVTHMQTRWPTVEQTTRFEQSELCLFKFDISLLKFRFKAIGHHRSISERYSTFLVLCTSIIAKLILTVTDMST